MYISAVKEKDNTLMYVINKTILALSEWEWCRRTVTADDWDISESHFYKRMETLKFSITEAYDFYENLHALDNTYFI